MNPERLKQIKQLFENALRRSPEERRTYVSSASEVDPDLRLQLISLLSEPDAEQEILSTDWDPDLAALIDPLLGRQVAHFKVTRVIGQGGMGRVYLGRDLLLDRLVALKFLSLQFQDNDIAGKRFLREAKSAARLDNPFVCSIFEVGESDEGSAFIAMEYVRGETLGARLARGPAPLQQSLKWALELAEALQVAHERGIIHRDLKPANIMLTETGHVKVMDFGLAKRVSIDSEDSRENPVATALTQQGTTLGTLTYMSPEQLQGKPVDARSDIFAFGIILYELISGQHPFERNSAIETAGAILHQEAPDLRQTCPDVPPLLAETVAQMLEKSQDRRCASARQVSERLTTLRETSSHSVRRLPVRQDDERLRQQSTVFEGQTAPDIPSPWWRRRRVQLSAVALLLLVLLIATPFVRQKLGLSLTDQVAEEFPLASTPYEHSQQGLALLRRYDKQGYIARALESFQSALQLDEDFALAYAGLSEVYLLRYYEENDRPDLDLAVQNGQKAVQLNAHLAVAQINLGVALTAAGQFEDARETLNEAVVLAPQNASGYRALGGLESTVGNLEAAETVYLKSIQLDPHDWRNEVDLGSLYYQQARYEEAETHFARAIEIVPDSAVGYRNLAAAYQKQNRLDDAITALQNSLAHRPIASVYGNLGTLYYFQGLYQKSASALEQAVQLRPNHYLGWANLGDVYRRISSKEEDAKQAFRRATQLVAERLTDRPEDADLNSRLALYLALGGEVDTALTQIEKTLKMGDQTPGLLRRLLLAYELSGKREEALQTLEATLEAGYPLEELKREPELAELRRDVRYHQVVSRFEN